MNLSAAMDELTQKLRQEFVVGTDQELQGAVDDLQEMREMQLSGAIFWATLLAIADECERRERPA